MKTKRMLSRAGVAALVALLLGAAAPASGADVWPRTDFDDAERVALAVRVLEHEAPSEQAHAIRTLEGHRAEAVPALIAAARERGPANPHLLYNILGALRQIGDPAATPLAAKALAEGGRDYPLRRRAAQTIGACGGPKAKEALLAALPTNYIPLAIDVINALVALKATDAGPAILARGKTMPEIRPIVLHVLSTSLAGSVAPDDLAAIVPDDASVALRSTYLEARGRLGDESAWAKLEAMLAAADSPELRIDVLGRLVAAGRPAGRREVEKLVGSDDPRLRAAALDLALGVPGLAPERIVESLGPREDRLAVFGRLKRIGPRMGEKTIRDAVTARFLDPEENPSVRVVAANALAESGSPEAWAPLLARLEAGGDSGDADSLTHSIGCALARAEGAVPRLIELVASDDPGTARGALAGLVRAGGRPAAAAAKGWLGRPERDARLEAAGVLGLIGTAADLGPMKAAWERERDPDVRRALAAAAERIARSGR